MALVFGQSSDHRSHPRNFRRLPHRKAQARDSIVTPQTPQIQDLIRQIDEALRKSSPRLPWLQSAEVTQQRRILLQTRTYLAGLQQQACEAEERPLTGKQSMGKQPADPSAETAQQVLQAVLQEMNYLRTNMLQPLRSDIDALQHRRETLTQEIQQLEAQKQQALPPANAQVNSQFVTEFLQSSMQQLQENLTGQVAHMVASLSAQSVEPPLLGSGEDSLSPAQRLQHMQQIQTQSDQLMMRLDSAIRIIFESMEANIHSYEDSLEQGLNRMHTLGQQGEAMFSALVNRLAEHLGRETSTYLQSSMPVDVPTSGFLPESETEIDQLLGELNALEDAEDAADLDDFDLGQDPFDFLGTPLPVTVAEDEEITLFQPDFEDEDVTRFQDGSELVPPLSSAPVEPPDLSSALDLLNQLNGEGLESAEDEEFDEAEAIAHDEFYQSLFGETADNVSDPIADLISESITDSIPEPVAEPTEPIAAESEALTEPADMSDLFFSGMGDPATDTTADEEIDAELAAAPHPADRSQSVEAFLLRTPDPEPSSSEPEVETIASLADLVDEEEDAIAPLLVEDENSYEPAHADENLLAGGESQQVILDPDALPLTAREILESDLSILEHAVAPPDPIQIQADMTLFDDSDAALPFPSDDPLAQDGLTLDGFDFAAHGDRAESELTFNGFDPSPDPPVDQGLSLDTFDPGLDSELDSNSESLIEPDLSASPSLESTLKNTMPQESSTPVQDLTGFNAFSFEGLDDPLFEPSPEPEAQPLEPEDLLKKKRLRSKGEPGRGFGR
jgi:hypothetical protein